MSICDQSAWVVTVMKCVQKQMCECGQIPTNRCQTCSAQICSSCVKRVQGKVSCKLCSKKMDLVAQSNEWINKPGTMGRSHSDLPMTRTDQLQNQAPEGSALFNFSSWTRQTLHVFELYFLTKSSTTVTIQIESLLSGTDCISKLTLNYWSL